MKKVVLLMAVVGLFVSCGNSVKQEKKEVEVDSLLSARATVFSGKLPREDGAFVMEKCAYDGKTVNITLRLRAGCEEMLSPETLKWLPAMELNEIHTLDTMMIKRLVELNQPLTYSVYASKGDSLIKKFVCTSSQLKGRAGSYGMLK